MNDTSDPLQRLGASLFLTIIANADFGAILNAERVCRSWRALIVKHTKSIWTRECRSVGVEAKHMAFLEAFESRPVLSWSGDPDEMEHQDPNEESRVDWRGICKSRVELDRNWRWGRCRDGWIAPADNAVWRFQIDPEQQTTIVSSRMGGLVIHDTSPQLLGPISHIRDVHPAAHVELAMGHVVFDIGEVNLTLQVYRTQSAINRSNHPTPAPNQRPRLTASAVGSPGFNGKTWARALPRGHLLYYRTISPPTECHAFRARVDREGQKERAVLATAGSEALYIWDLDDASRVERISIPQGQRHSVQYVEFDEEYIFVCSLLQMHIYSRRTRTHILSFPPDPENIYTTASQAFALDTLHDVAPVQSPNGRMAMGRAELTATDRGSDVWRRVLERSTEAGLTRQRGSDSVVMDFTACHYTPTDLICTARLGVILIVRNYRAALASPSFEERQRRVVDSTVWLGTGSAVHLLAVHDTQVAAVMSTALISFDTRSLASTPPHLNVHAPLGMHPEGLSLASCVQMDRKKLYFSYWAAGEHEANPHAQLPMEALQASGMCIRVLDFSVPAN
ncbi:hypothetical protein BD324DRAFT_635358 [Kockovaella imperatae]|uniref:F-box domain-containing protein n=1 Tax=Kockovaella imperatae TaxID=4999 RepID=A0A1Y1U9Z5_9TREE|nr:hypothetical protein BD324DRAFT_635358 [Kockovaella imperatae]ORX34848.1 hypothetical protein BD324DRAFT_635358 [Kockovaella imperatae]